MEAMAEKRQWVLWGKGDKGKVPFLVIKGKLVPINLTIRNNFNYNFMNLKKSMNVLKKFKGKNIEVSKGEYIIQGIGYYFGENDNYIVIDLDNCFKDTGEVRECFREIISIAERKTVIYYSSSGRGLHIIAKNDIDIDINNLGIKFGDLNDYNYKKLFGATKAKDLKSKSKDKMPGIDILVRNKLIAFTFENYKNNDNFKPINLNYSQLENHIGKINALIEKQKAKAKVKAQRQRQRQAQQKQRQKQRQRQSKINIPGRKYIEKLKERVNIQDVIEKYTSIKMELKEKYNCPFKDHKDRNASFTILDNKKAYCFGCTNRNGMHAYDIFDFVEKYFDLGFKEARNKIAKDFC